MTPLRLINIELNTVNKIGKIWKTSVLLNSAKSSLRSGTTAGIRELDSSAFP